MTRTEKNEASKAATIEISDSAQLPSDPLVSVYMLAYKHEKFIAEAIEGVIAQQCRFPIELIIGEDCSPDGTREIVLGYQKRYPMLVRVLTSPTNVGAHANAERCLRAARGKFIAICEGDDHWHHPLKLEMQVEAFSKYDHVTLCHTDFDRQVRFGIKRNQHRAMKSPYLAKGQAYEALLHSWTIMTVTAMYRADVLRAFLASPFHERRWPFGDYNKALFAAVHGNVAYLPVSTATWRKVSGSATNDSVEAYLNMALCYSECRERFLVTYPVSDDVTKRVRTESRLRIMHRAFWAGRLDLFDECDAWLAQSSQTPNAVLTKLQRQILKRSSLVKCSQFLRRFIRQVRLIRR